MSVTEDAKTAILKKVAEFASDATPLQLLYLAEAYAWAVYPNQSHGGTQPQPK